LAGKVPVNQEVDLEGVKVFYFDFVNFFEFMGATGWQFSWKMTKALKDNLKSFDIIYIVAIWNYPTAVAAYYCRRYKKPYIISPRGHLFLATLRKKYWGKLPYYHLVAKRDLNSASAIHYTTEDEVKCHSSLGLKNKAIVIPNGIDLSEFADLPKRERLRDRYPYLKDKKVILFLSRINWKKGLDLLVKAYSVLAKERDDVHLLIVGNDEGGYGEKVKRWIKDKGIMKRVTFTGMLIEKDKMEAYAGSDIFVLPSYSENFGMVAIEAMACGIPVVISNQVGIYQEVGKKKAGIVVETNPESLLEGIRTVLDNNELRAEIAINGKKLVRESYDIDKVADMMIDAYEEIIGTC